MKKPKNLEHQLKLPEKQNDVENVGETKLEEGDNKKKENENKNNSIKMKNEEAPAKNINIDGQQQPVVNNTPQKKGKKCGC